MSTAETQAQPVRAHVGREPYATERVRELVTPEGIDLRLRLAEVSERATAFFIDVAIIVGALVGMTLLAFLTMASVGRSSAEISVIIWMLASFYRSQDLTLGHRWAIFGLFVAYYIVQIIISMTVFSIMGLGFMTNSPFEAALIAAAAVNTWPVILASALAQMINAILSAAGTASIYYELRQIKDGIGPESLASVFD